MPAIDHYRLRSYICGSDYLVQLSDGEGYCYAVHEALADGTAVIVTDIDAFKEIIQNGYNGYKVPLDMNPENIPINNIINNIPQHFGFNQDISGIEEKWKKILE